MAFSVNIGEKMSNDVNNSNCYHETRLKRKINLIKFNIFLKLED